MKFKSPFQAIMWFTSGISFMCMIFCFGIYKIEGNEVVLALGVTALTLFYHFAVRIFLGEWLLKKIRPARWNYRNKWFQQKKFETHFYKLLNVKAWKNRMPTYAPEEFSVKNLSWEELVIATCESEAVHESNMLASFVPVLFSLKFGCLPVFLITSVLAACLDCVFVIIQRYNRPRMVRLIR